MSELERVKKSIVDMEILKNADSWKTLKEKFEKENEPLIEELYNECPKDIRLTIHDIWKEQLKFIDQLYPLIKLALVGLDANEYVYKFIDGVIESHRDAIIEEMTVDFDDKYSKHDLIRNALRFKKKLFLFPDEYIKDAEKHAEVLAVEASATDEMPEDTNIEG